MEFFSHYKYSHLSDGAGALPPSPPVVTSDDLIRKILTWLDLPTVREQRRYLEAHSEILQEQTDTILHEQIKQAARDQKKVLQLREAMNLIRDGRARGGTMEAIREAYINAHGGFALDIPSWLEEVEQHLTALRLSSRPDQTSKERTGLLQDTLARVHSTLDLTPEIDATLQHELARVFLEYPRIEYVHALEVALQACKEALTIYTFHRYLQQYAKIQDTLGVVYRERVQGERRENIEQAIACFHEALRVHTLECFPYQYAQTQHNFGVAYWRRIAGERRENIEQAILSFQKALQVRTVHAFPYEYAHTQYVLGIAYLDRLTGERRSNQEQAIACFQESLRIRTLEDYPYQYAETQNSLGIAYLECSYTGERRSNQEQAIACFREVLRVHTRDTFPYEFARTQNNLGNVYLDRLTGERRGNQEQAITCYREALQIRRIEVFPSDYARTQHNLGMAYLDRIAGERGDNLEQAITCFREALRVYSLDTFPYDFARVQHDLGIAYLDRMMGERKVNQEQAIACQFEALRVYASAADTYEYAAIQDSLGTVYRERIAGERRDNLEQAIAYYRQALHVFRLETYPYYYALAQHNLGLTYSQRIEGDRQENHQQALACFHEALRVYTQEAFPDEHRRVHLDYAQTEARGGNWLAVHDAYTAALEAEDTLVTLGAGAVGRDAILKQGGDAAIRDGFALTRLGRVEEAAVVIERGRARGLAEAMALNAADPERIGNLQRREHYTSVRQALIAAQDNLHASMPPDLDDDAQRRLGLERSTAYWQAKEVFDTVVAEIRQVQDPADFLYAPLSSTTILRAVEPIGTGHVFVYLAATPWGGRRLLPSALTPI